MPTSSFSPDKVKLGTLVVTVERLSGTEDVRILKVCIVQEGLWEVVAMSPQSRQTESALVNNGPVSGSKVGARRVPACIEYYGGCSSELLLARSFGRF